MSTAARYRLVRAEPAPAVPPVLDERQRAVVEHADGPLLVLAGPGTGKTTTLVEAVAARVDAGVPVERLLLLTFSRRAAGELRERVATRLDRTVREPIARTLHSYAYGVLRLAALRSGGPAPRLLGAAEQDVVVRDLLAGGDASAWPAELRPALATIGFADELRDLLMRAVERGLDGPGLAALGRARGRPDWVAAGRFLREYHEVTVLRDAGSYDPAELIQAALTALRDDPELLAAERERRRRIFVDEFQDTDPAQAELLALLAAGADELVLVGDPDQSIYAFRGADDSALREVDRRFGGGAAVPVLALRTGRRSGPALLEATRRVAARLPGPAGQRAVVPADGLPTGSVEVAVLRSASEEAAHVAGRLRAAFLDGLPWSRMAVLVRSTATTLGPLRRAMITAGVPVTVRGEDLPLAEQPAVAMLLTVLDCSLHPQRLTEPLAESLLLGPLGGADSVQVRRLRRELRRRFPDEGGGLVPALADPAGARLTLPDRLARPVSALAGVLAAGRAAADGDVESLLWSVWSASGLARTWAAASLAGGAGAVAADRDLDAVVALFDEAARFTDRLPHLGAADFVEYIGAQSLPAGAGPDGRAAEAVSILTAHSSKGMEWDLVCVAHVQEGAWPDLRRRGSLLGSEELVDAVRGVPAAGPGSFAPQLAEERRLFYVAATRARKQLVVTAVAGQEEQPSRFLDELDPVDGERVLTRARRGVHLPGLVSELRAVVCDPAAGRTTRVGAARELARLAAADVPCADPDQWWGLAAVSTDAGVADSDRPVPVSPSRIDSFRSCELRTVLEGFGVRDDAEVAASLGSIVHALAEAAPDDQPLAEFERQLDEVWATIDFGASWFADNERRRASAMLQRLVTWLRESRERLTRVGVELDFDVTVGDAQLRGRVDRVDRDAEGRLVIVDLKTGKGRPSDADLPTHPQLGAYQLAAEHGAFPGDGTQSGGALLVQLAGGRVEQWQPPLAAADDPQWARRTVDEVAARLRGHEFTATENARCHVCPVRGCCPLQAEGRPVTG